jgi:hypothetical protein
MMGDGWDEPDKFCGIKAGRGVGAAEDISCLKGCLGPVANRFFSTGGGIIR